MQVMAAGRRGTHDRPQIFGAGRDQSRRQDAFFDQPVAPIDIGDGFLEQFGPLHETGADRHPFAVFDKQRHMRQRPFALIGASLVVDPVVDAGIAQILVGAGKALAELFGTEIVECLDEMLPHRAGIACSVDHLVDDAVDRLVVLQQAVDLRLAAYPFVIPLCHR